MNKYDESAIHINMLETKKRRVNINKNQGANRFNAVYHPTLECPIVEQSKNDANNINEI